MRKNIQGVWDAWLKGNFKSMGSVRTDGNSIFSYQEKILYQEEGGYRLNTKKYSVTTSTLQNSLRALLEEHKIPFQECI